MILIAHDFWSIVVYCFFASVLFIGYRLTWRLAYFSESLIVGLARAGMHSMARGLLFTLIGYTEQTYHRSRFIIWNQVHVRFFGLYATTLALTGVIFLFQIRPLIWGSVALLILGCRLLLVWLNPPRPPIHTSDPALKQLIQDVNEPLRPAAKRAQPMFRRWDYLDELFAEIA